MFLLPPQSSAVVQKRNTLAVQCDIWYKTVYLKRSEASAAPVSHPVTFALLRPTAEPFGFSLKSLRPNELSFISIVWMDGGAW